LIDGSDQPALAERLAELLVSESPAGLYRCELRLANYGPDAQGGAGYLYFDRRLLDFGKALAVRIAGDTVFSGRISALEGRFAGSAPPELGVLAEDQLNDLRMTRRSRVFENLSDADLVRRLASDHGLSADVGISGPTHRVLAQLNDSDLALLRGRARLAGFELRLDGQTLQAQPRSSRRASDTTLDYGGTLQRFDVIADLAGQASRVRIGGWDVAAKRALQADDSAAALAAEAGAGGQLGSSLLRQALGERVEHVAHLFPANQAEADALARAWLAQMARRFVRGRGVAQSQASLRVGSTVTLNGLGPLFSGRYDVVGICHRFDASHGLRTEFEAERAWVGAAS